MSNKSWGWKILPMTAEDAAHYERGATSEQWPQYRHCYLCRKKGCDKLPEVYVSYLYVTGRAGRVTDNRKPYCRAHGEEIVAAHQKEAA